MLMELCEGKPSKLIELAMKDLALCEKTPGLQVNMYVWLSNSVNTPTVCKVCLAGAVMYQSLGIRPRSGREMMPMHCDTAEKPLESLNYFRNGRLADAFHAFGIEHPSGLPRRIAVTDYHENADLFRRDMQALVKTLADAGV